VPNDGKTRTHELVWELALELVYIIPALPIHDDLPDFNAAGAAKPKKNGPKSP
jgi:hypothetical protein